jgi:hypothetical protein
MKGVLIQILNVDEIPIGMWYTEEKELMENTGMLVDWFRSYDDSDMYNEERVDGFSNFVRDMGYKILRVFTYQEFL